MVEQTAAPWDATSAAWKAACWAVGLVAEKAVLKDDPVAADLAAPMVALLDWISVEDLAVRTVAARAGKSADSKDAHSAARWAACLAARSAAWMAVKTASSMAASWVDR